MKRLRKIAHLAFVWTSVCLLLIDPATACKLRNRRCCCPCECPPIACEAAAPVVSAEAALPIASAQAAIGAGQLPPTPLAADSRPVAPTQPAARGPLGLPSAVRPSLADRGPTTPVHLSPARSNEPQIVEPTIAPAALSTATRQPASAAPPTATEIAPPAVAADNRPTEARGVEPPAPLPANLQQRQAVDSTVTSAPATSGPDATPPVASTSVTPSTPSAARRSDDMPPMPVADSPVVSPPKTPTKPESSTPAAPVVPPAFPPVADDPFAPPAPAVATPKNTETHEDDPFAPLKPATQSEAKPVAPIAAEPTMKRIDPLQLGPDGQLPARQWSDSSGQFQVKGRLLLILDGKVRLLKETGRTTTVPTERLSEGDRAYVEEVISRYGKDLAKLGELAAG